MSIQRTGQYGYQAAINAKQYDKYTLAEASIRITPENTVFEDSLKFSQKALENIMAYTQEDMKLVDGNLPDTQADGAITVDELEQHFKGGFDDKKLNDFAKQRAQQFMLAFDRSNGNGHEPDGKLTLDELTARQIIELNPRKAFSQVIASEKDQIQSLQETERLNLDEWSAITQVEAAQTLDSNTLPGFSTSLTELALNASQINETQATAGISSPEKRAFLANQFEFDAEKVGLVADQVMESYQLSNFAKDMFDMFA